MEIERLRVLLIEDNPVDARVIEWCLKDLEGVQIQLDQARRLAEGLATLSSENFDAILLDLCLPESMGLDTLHEVRRRHPGVPIVVITGLGSAEVAVDALKAGADDYLVKGRLDGRQLVRAIQYARERVARRKAERNLQASNQALRMMACELTIAEQRERRRFAGVLHEHLQQSLVAAQLKIEALRKQAGSSGLCQLAKEAEDLLHQCVHQSRSLVRELSPLALYDAGLAAGLEWLARQMKENYALVVDIQADHSVQVEDDLSMLLFHAAREVLLNVVEHARVHAAQLVMRRTNGQYLQLQVTDAGVGFDPSASEIPQAGQGLSLFTLRQHLTLLGGNLEVSSARGEGTRVLIKSPLRREAWGPATELRRLNWP